MGRTGKRRSDPDLPRGPERSRGQLCAGYSNRSGRFVQRRAASAGDDSAADGEDYPGQVPGLVRSRPRSDPATRRRCPELDPTPEQVAQRKPCEDFDDFRLEFEAVQADIESGRQTTELFKFSSRSQIVKGDWFIVDGHKAMVAEVGKWFTPEHGERDRRLRVIFDNGTEADLLLRSLRRALNKDENSRRIIPPQPASDDDDSDFGPLFSGVAGNDDTASGTIYVARSLSDDSFIQEHREVLHKIGVTGGDPYSRIAGAKKDPTFLLAEAKLVASYKLANINRKALEATLHKFFAKARLDVALADRFGGQVRPREWFLVPLPVIAEVVDRIKDGTIGKYRYDAERATLQLRQ
ncbi:MAG: GIY-YIG nuclease family protein [Planctomycetaceae bacterium]|nr:GIY-YIG nuclease family protein [Planctomycetaceae bacterium]